MPSHVLAGMLAIPLMVAVPEIVSAQNYPNKPIRVITFPGGFADFTVRTIAQAMPELGQPIVIENRGLRRTDAAELVARATPDGYTLLVVGSTLWQTPFLYENVQYDAVKDFSPVTIATTQPSLLVVHPGVAANSVKELIALAKARPGELSYSSNPGGAENHLAAELFKSMTGVNIVRVRYERTVPALASLLDGKVQVMFPNAAAVVPYMSAGKVRALAVTSEHPSALLPKLPTLSASGLPGFDSGTIQGVLAPAKTPTANISRLNHLIVQTLNKPDVKKRFFDAGVETVGNSSREFAAEIKTDRARWGKLIKSAGIRAD